MKRDVRDARTFVLFKQHGAVAHLWQHKKQESIQSPGTFSFFLLHLLMAFPFDTWAKNNRQQRILILFNKWFLISHNTSCVRCRFGFLLFTVLFRRSRQPHVFPTLLWLSMPPFPSVLESRFEDERNRRTRIALRWTRMRGQYWTLESCPLLSLPVNANLLYTNPTSNFKPYFTYLFLEWTNKGCLPEASVGNWYRKSA